MHVVGFIIRIYHDARSSERQILHECVQNLPNDLVHYNVSWSHTKRPRDRQSASWRQKPNIYKSGDSPNVTVFINTLHTKIRQSNWKSSAR